MFDSRNWHGRDRCLLRWWLSSRRRNRRCRGSRGWRCRFRRWWCCCCCWRRFRGFRRLRRWCGCGRLLRRGCGHCAASRADVDGTQLLPRLHCIAILNKELLYDAGSGRWYRNRSLRTNVILKNKIFPMFPVTIAIISISCYNWKK